MTRRSAAFALTASLALAGGLAACGKAEVAQPSNTIVPTCKAAEFVPATTPPGTDATGGTTPPGTVDKPPVSIDPGPLPTELQKIDIKVGDGAEVVEGHQVKVHYVGVACTTGEEFDTSYGGEPAEFPLEGVIPGFKEGLLGMKAGGRRQIVIPGDKAYTKNNPPQPGSGIGVNEPLFFVVDLVSTAPAPVTTTTTVPVPGATTTTTAPGTPAPEGTAAPTTAGTTAGSTPG